MTLRLFSRPFDHEQILADLAEPGFCSLVFILTGLGEDSWRAAMLETAELIEDLEARRLAWVPAYALLGVLIQRAETFTNTGALLDEMVERLGLLPGTTFLEDIKMANLHKVDPRAWQDVRDRRWIERYRKYRGFDDEPAPGDGRG